MKKSILAALLVLLVAGCAVLTSCQTKGQDVEYRALGLELKNKTEKVITEFYLYPTGSAEKYNDLVTGFGVDGKWKPGKGGVYVYCFVIRPAAETYEIEVIYEDGTKMIVPGIDLFKADSDGRFPNEISLKPDPDEVKVKFDDDPDVQPAIYAAIAAGVPVDGYYPN